jgi:very-short-patch-repair endonuclease
VITARLLRSSGLPKPERQVEVATLEGTYRLDFAWPDRLVALECDGRTWHETERDFERDRQRWSAITAHTGYRIVWATWRQVRDEPEQILSRLRTLLRSGGRGAAAIATTTRARLAPAARTSGGHRDDVVGRRPDESQWRARPA